MAHPRLLVLSLAGEGSTEESDVCLKLVSLGMGWVVRPSLELPATNLPLWICVVGARVGRWHSEDIRGWGCLFLNLYRLLCVAS